eukprot:c29107_g1_i1 orf=1652-2224(-)
MARNRLGGVLPYNLSLGKSLKLLDISFNLFTGPLPPHIIAAAAAEDMVIRLQRNCFSTKFQSETHAYSYCQAAALASGISPRMPNRSVRGRQIGFLAGIIAGILAVVAASLVLMAIVLRRKHSGPVKSVQGLHADNYISAVSPELLSSASTSFFVPDPCLAFLERSGCVFVCGGALAGYVHLFIYDVELN